MNGSCLICGYDKPWRVWHKDGAAGVCGDCFEAVAARDTAERAREAATERWAEAMEHGLNMEDGVKWAEAALAEAVAARDEARADAVKWQEYGLRMSNAASGAEDERDEARRERDNREEAANNWHAAYFAERDARHVAERLKDDATMLWDDANKRAVAAETSRDIAVDALERATEVLEHAGKWGPQHPNYLSDAAKAARAALVELNPDAEEVMPVKPSLTGDPGFVSPTAMPAVTPEPYVRLASASSGAVELNPDGLSGKTTTSRPMFEVLDEIDAEEQASLNPDGLSEPGQQPLLAGADPGSLSPSSEVAAPRFRKGGGDGEHTSNPAGSPKVKDTPVAAEAAPGEFPPGFVWSDEEARPVYSSQRSDAGGEDIGAVGLSGEDASDRRSAQCHCKWGASGSHEPDCPCAAEAAPERAGGHAQVTTHTHVLVSASEAGALCTCGWQGTLAAFKGHGGGSPEAGE